MVTSFDPQSKFWAITTFFTFDDPPGQARRIAAYREFRRRLGVPLAAVELAQDGRFDLGSDDADILIQLEGGSLLWQKERLLNIALENLPESCDTVAWIDCDVVPRRPDWAQATDRLLDEVMLVQPFQYLHYLGAGESPDAFAPNPKERVFESAVARWLRGEMPDHVFHSTGVSQELAYSPGMAWAARRQFLDEHGFYDGLVMGSGDKAMFSAACGAHERAPDVYGMSASHREHFLEWAEPFSRAVAGRLGFIEGEILHIWHGDLPSRKYRSRYDGFERHAFCPRTDVCKQANGVWRWSSEKPELHEAIRSWFEGRKGLVPTARPAA